MQQSIMPKLFTVMKGYNREQLVKDIVAGILVGIIAIPLSIALAISSGVGPEMGLYTAVVAGFLISFFGGSRVQIGGPTAAFVPVVYAIVQEHGVNGLAVAAIMAGIFLVIMGVCKLGKMIKYIPYPVVTGFTAGIAVAIGAKQVKDLLGLGLESVPGEFIPMCKAYGGAIGTMDGVTVGVGALALVVIMLWGKLPWKWVKFVPGSLVAIVLTTVGVVWLGLDSVATIGSRFSDIGGGMPKFALPSGVDSAMIHDLVGPALTIAVLAGVESLLSAVVSDGMIGGHHRSNAELVGQGLANIGSAMFGGIPATGAIARTAANVRGGGRTPIAGVAHSVTVLLIIVVLMPYAKMIPLTTLGAVLIMVAYNMGDWTAFRDIRKAPKSDAIVFLLTFLLTVVFDLVIAIEVGMVLAAFLFMKRMADVAEVNDRVGGESEGDELEDGEMRGELKRKYGEEVLLYEVRGAFFFGAADKFVDMTKKMGNGTKAIVIKMKEVPAMDATGMHFLETFYGVCKRDGVKMYLTHVQNHPMQVLERRGFIDMLGKKQICKDTMAAVMQYELDSVAGHIGDEVEKAEIL